MIDNIESVIINNLVNSDTFARKALPHLKKEYFTDEYVPVFELIHAFITKYNKLPTSNALSVELQKSELMNRQDASLIYEIIKETAIDLNSDLEWLLDVTEEWCKDRAVTLAILEAFEIISEPNSKKSAGAIPDMLNSALSVTFDTSVGHDYLEDVDERYKFYTTDEEKIPFDIDMLNKITGGGIPRKTLNIILAGTGAGKTLSMCHLAAANLSLGKNVLYITMEMADKKIAERVDANLLDIDIAQMKHVDEAFFKSKLQSLKQKTQGKFILKEYPTGAAHVGHFRALLNELKMKKDFKPDVIYVDYLNICASSRVNMSVAGGSYGLVKSIAEEVRGLAVEFDVPIWSATQTNRDGLNSSDVDLTNISESMGLAHTADLLFALYSNDELKANNQLLIKQLKNRYNDLEPNKFLVGIDRSRMRLFDLNDSSVAAPGGGGAASPPVGMSPFAATQRPSFNDLKT